jgi:hypothetical protein
MEDRDFFFQNQIDKLSDTLNSLIGSIKDCEDEDEINQKLETINEGILNSLNINLEEVNNIPLEHFIATITIDNIIDNHILDLLAELFFQTAKAFSILKEKEQAKRLFHRSLIIYKFLLKVEIDFPYERHLRIKELNEILLQ